MNELINPQKDDLRNKIGAITGTTTASFYTEVGSLWVPIKDAIHEDLCFEIDWQLDNEIGNKIDNLNQE